MLFSSAHDFESTARRFFLINEGSAYHGKALISWFNNERVAPELPLR
jgi:hypothetical protein